MGRVKASEWPSSTVVGPWAPNELETVMKDDSEEHACAMQSKIDTAMSKMLRIMLGSSSNQPINHSSLRSKALAGVENDLSKCVVDLALLNLVNQGLLSQHGYGNFSLYTIPPEAVHEATELAYLEFSATEDSRYSINQQQYHNHQQQSTLGFAPPLPISAPPCAIFRPASPRPRSGRSYSTEKMSSALHRVRLHGKRSHSSTNSLNLEESHGGGGGGGGGLVNREKRARLGRPSHSVLVNGNNTTTTSTGPVPMSP